MEKADADKTMRGPLAGLLTAIFVLSIPALTRQFGLSSDASGVYEMVALVTLPALLFSHCKYCRRCSAPSSTNEFIAETLDPKKVEELFILSGLMVGSRLSPRHYG